MCFSRREGNEAAPGFIFSLPFIISHFTTQLHYIKTHTVTLTPVHYTDTRPTCNVVCSRAGLSLQTQHTHSTLFSAFLFVSSYSPFIIILSIIWYLLLPRTFFPFTIPSIYKCQSIRLISQYFVSFSLNRLLFVYNFAVISNGMPNITQLFRLPSPGRNCRVLYVW